ncbi:MAG: glycosyltransferase family 4 protein [Caldilineaceae bacterium]|nr:glycosyltransferase family 4 protein [Caldilineaceae bacterium]
MNPAFPIRVLYLSGYTHPMHHRKVELLADAENLEILNINGLDCDRKSGRYPSADGRRSYDIINLPTAYLLNQDVHRVFYWPPRFQLRSFRPHLIYCEHEQESLMALEASIMRSLFCPGAPLILYSWQNILRKRNIFVRMVSDATLRAAQHIFCASSEGIEVLRQQGYIHGATVVQQMGTDTSLFHPMPGHTLRAQLGLTGMVIGYIGRLAPEKGVDTLLQAATEISTPYQILLIGSGSEKQRLQALAETYGIAQHCLWLDALPYEQVPHYLNVLDVLVLPSRTTPNWKEQFGRVLIEAMACKAPVVGSDSGAIPEVIGDAGCIFPEGNSRRLAEVLKLLFEQPELRLQLGEAGFKRVQAHYTVERLAAKTLSAWLSVVKNAPDGVAT